MLAMRIVLFLPMQSSFTNFCRSFTGLVQLIFSFPIADFTLSDSTALTHFMLSLANYTLLSLWIERHDHSVHMSSILLAQQLYTVSIPLLEAYLLPMANNRTRNKRLSQEQNSR